MQLRYFDAAAEYLPDVCFATPPDLGVLLGSGWGVALKSDEVVFRASYADIPGLGASTVKGHSGEFVLYRRGGGINRTIFHKAIDIPGHVSYNVI